MAVILSHMLGPLGCTCNLKHFQLQFKKKGTFHGMQFGSRAVNTRDAKGQVAVAGLLFSS